LSFVATNEEACAYRSEQVITIVWRWFASAHQNWTVPYEWLSVPVSEVLCSIPASGYEPVVLTV
jgi:ABC-type anion transport system duplicated permease subunit